MNSGRLFSSIGQGEGSKTLQVFFTPIRSLFSRPLQHPLFIQLSVFAAYLATTQFGQLIYFVYDTSPAVIWPSIGVGLAAVLLAGYRVWIAIAVAQTVSMLSLPGSIPPLVLLASTIGYTLQPLFGAWLLRRFRFQPAMDRAVDSILLAVFALLISFVAPVFMITAQLVTNSLDTTLWLAASRAWAAGVFSILVFTPIITTWSHTTHHLRTSFSLESITAFALFLGAVFLTFWTTMPQLNIFVSLYFLLAALVWIGLRTNMRMMSLAIFLMAMFGIAGAFIAQPSNAPLYQYLLSIQLFVVLLAPMFYIITALVEERRHSERDLMDYATELERALKSLAQNDLTKNDFIAVLAHELRNPLAPVLSAVELMRLTGDPNVRPVLDQAHRQIITMRHLLDDLLDVVRITKQKLSLQRKTVDIRPLVQNSIANVNEHFTERRHTVHLDLPETEQRLFVDPLRFEQILTNLLHNAAKYTEPGGHVSVHITEHEREVSIAIEDNGIGIDPTKLKEIFEPFRQGQTQSRFGTGLGIGLALTKQLVALHDGTITAHSDGRGKGSVFTVRFPKVHAARKA